MKRTAIITFSCLVLMGIGTASAQKHDAGPGGPSVAAYPTIQDAIRANPGRMIYVPAGDYTITENLRIDTDRTGLFGPGRIIQANPNRQIIEVEHASGVQLRDLTLTRAEGKQDTNAEGVGAADCRDLVLENLQVIDNRTRSSAIALRDCKTSQVRNCLVANYQRVSIDDRTANKELGYAFRCLIGTGIMVRDSEGTLVQGNRVVERNLFPTPEAKRQHELGRYVKKNAAPGRLTSKRDWDRDATDNWLQSTAIHIASPKTTDATQVIGNYVENTGQGIDIHADHVIVSQNLIRDTLIGMKAMHGSRHVLIVGNQFMKNSLWAIGLMPGASSHPARPATSGAKAEEANVDGGSIIANNIISDFGYGRTRWIWGGGDDGSPLRFDRGQLPENPPLSEVIIQGNMVYDTGRDEILVDGAPRVAPPRYRYALRVEQGGNGPRGLHVSNNILHPGTDGVSNVELRP